MSVVPPSTTFPAHLLLITTLRLISLAPSANLTHVRSAPLRVLSEVFERYLELLARSAKERAEVAGRTSVSIYDADEVLKEFIVDLDGLRECKELTDGQGELESLGALLKGAFRVLSRLMAIAQVCPQHRTPRRRPATPTCPEAHLPSPHRRRD
jgi:histone H3/H4